MTLPAQAFHAVTPPSSLEAILRDGYVAPGVERIHPASFWGVCTSRLSEGRVEGEIRAIEALREVAHAKLKALSRFQDQEGFTPEQVDSRTPIL